MRLTDTRVPLYREAKLVLALWMVMPQTQGATYLYLNYLHPHIAQHEQDLDKLLVRLHEQVRSRGGQYVEILVLKVSEILFGPQAATGAAYLQSMREGASGVPTSTEQQSTGKSDSASGYIASLFSRFRTVPVSSAPETLPSSLLNFVNMAYNNRAGDIIPAHLSPEQRSRYVQQQKQKLQEWLHMLEVAESSYPSISVTPDNSTNTRSSARQPPHEASRRNSRLPSGMGMGAPPASSSEAQMRGPSGKYPGSRSVSDARGPVGGMMTGAPSRSVSGAAGSAAQNAGARTPVDSDYEDLGNEEHLRKLATPESPEKSSGWFWRSRNNNAGNISD